MDRPRRDRGHITPAGGTVRLNLSRPDHIWNNNGYGAVCFLVAAQIAQPFGEESRDIHIESRGATERLSIASPSQPFVSLRAVRRHIEKIAFLSPHNVVLQFV